MQYRNFGRVAWPVSEIGYGMWGMAGWTGSADPESFASLDRAIELGCNFFDTAWAYGDGRSERLLGETVHANPAKRLSTANCSDARDSASSEPLQPAIPHMP